MIQLVNFTSAANSYMKKLNLQNTGYATGLKSAKIS